MTNMGDRSILAEVDTSRRGRSLKTKEVAEETQVRHQELINEALLHKINAPRIITRDEHVINVQKNSGNQEGKWGQRARLW